MQMGEILGWGKTEDPVQKLFSVRVVPGIRFPDLVSHDMKLLDGSFVLPDADLLRLGRCGLAESPNSKYSKFCFGNGELRFDSPNSLIGSHAFNSNKAP